MYLIVYGFNQFFEVNSFWDAKGAIVAYYEFAGGNYEIKSELFEKIIKGVSIEEAVEICNSLIDKDDGIRAIFSNVMVTFDSRKKAE